MRPLIVLLSSVRAVDWERHLHREEPSLSYLLKKPVELSPDEMRELQKDAKELIGKDPKTESPRSASVTSRIDAHCKQVGELFYTIPSEFFALFSIFMTYGALWRILPVKHIIATLIPISIIGLILLNNFTLSLLCASPLLLIFTSGFNLVVPMLCVQLMIIAWLAIKGDWMTIAEGAFFLVGLAAITQGRHIWALFAIRGGVLFVWMVSMIWNEFLEKWEEFLIIAYTKSDAELEIENCQLRRMLSRTEYDRELYKKKYDRELYKNYTKSDAEYDRELYKKRYKKRYNGSYWKKKYEKLLTSKKSHSSV